MYAAGAASWRACAKGLGGAATSLLDRRRPTARARIPAAAEGRALRAIWGAAGARVLRPHFAALRGCAPMHLLLRALASASAEAVADGPAIFRHSWRAKRNRGHVEAPPAPPWPPCPAPHMPVVRNKLALSLAATKAPVSADRRRTRASRQGTVAETNARRSNCAAQRHNHLHSVSSAASASIANRSRDICSAESVSTASMASRPNWLP